MSLVDQAAGLHGLTLFDSKRSDSETSEKNDRPLRLLNANDSYSAQRNDRVCINKPAFLSLDGLIKPMKCCWDKSSFYQEKTVSLVSWYFELSQPQRITSGPNINFALSSGYPFHKSSYHKSCLLSLFIFRGHSTRELDSGRVNMKLTDLVWQKL